jgi:hypothetical protein
MHQDPDDAELIKAHLRKYGERLECPVCQTNAWEVGGPIGHLVTDQVLPKAGEIFRPPVMFTLAFMTCNTCGYLRQFSWAVIREAAKKSG